MPTSGMLTLVALVITEVSEECITPIIRVTRISELGTTLAVPSNRSTLRTSTLSYFLVTKYRSKWRISFKNMSQFEYL
jgi:lambda repressor-like predicted transcriptional regulator